MSYSLHRPHVAAPTQTARRTRRTEQRPVRRTRVELISEGVVAGYIHNISQRHAPSRLRGEDR